MSNIGTQTYTGPYKNTRCGARVKVLYTILWDNKKKICSQGSGKCENAKSYL